MPYNTKLDNLITCTKGKLSVRVTLLRLRLCDAHTFPLQTAGTTPELRLINKRRELSSSGFRLISVTQTGYSEHKEVYDGHLILILLDWIAFHRADRFSCGHKLTRRNNPESISSSRAFELNFLAPSCG